MATEQHGEKPAEYATNSVSFPGQYFDDEKFLSNGYPQLNDDPNLHTHQAYSGANSCVSRKCLWSIEYAKQPCLR